jgi:Zn-dependent protease
MHVSEGIRHLIFLHSDLIGEDNVLYLTLVAATLFALLVGICFHEACHAFTAKALGDPTPERQGRTTLNPLAHLDPLGTILMLIIGFGWGKPVNFNPYGLQVRPKTAMLLVAGAGPLSNFVAAFLLALPIRLDMVPYFDPFSARFFGVDTTEDYLGLFLTTTVTLNIILGVFNLIPIHPLDGFKVVLGLLPEDLSSEFAKLAQYGPPTLMVLIALGYFTGFNPLREIIGPTALWFLEFTTGIDA